MVGVFSAICLFSFCIAIAMLFSDSANFFINRDLSYVKDIVFSMVVILLSLVVFSYLQLLYGVDYGF